MSEGSIDRTFGRRAFGFDPSGYDAARPAYPDWVFEVLCERCGVAPGASTFEIGPGTGKATRRLLRLGVNPLIAIEPDRRLSAFLQETIPDKALKVVESTFEEATLRESAFDLGFSAASFHWLDEGPALEKAARLLRPGGWWAAVWNVFHDPDRPDPFHEATKALLNGPSSPSAGRGGVSFALDTQARLEALRQAGAFESVEHRTSTWPLVLDPDQTVALYATYSDIIAHPEREAVLAELGRVAREEFHGRVTRNIVTSLYIARRRSRLIA